MGIGGRGPGEKQLTGVCVRKGMRRGNNARVEKKAGWEPSGECQRHIPIFIRALASALTFGCLSDPSAEAGFWEAASCPCG